MIRRALGWLPDLPDDRDYVLDAPLLSARVAPPVACDCGHVLPWVFDQEGEASCVLQAVAAAIWAAHVRSADVQPPYELISRKGAWWLARHEAGSQAHNVGTRTRTAFRVLNARGFCRESHWDHGKPHQQRPSVHAAGMMIDQRSRGPERVRYERISERGSAMLGAFKAAIAADTPPVVGLYVGDAFFAYEPGTVLDAPAEDEDTGGHAMVVYGYAPHEGGTRWRLRNSHGAHYGERGDLWITDAYMLSARDPWLAVDAPPFSDTVTP